MVDFYKYLKCPECRDAGLYCPPHKKEVERQLQKEKQYAYRN